jgi:uncharacterized protein (DUF1697 family)
VFLLKYYYLPPLHLVEEGVFIHHFLILMANNLYTYISLLKGINVGGNKKILMADLKQLYETCGCVAVQTYIQSGNVVLQSNLSAQDVSAAVSRAIELRYGFEVAVLCLTHSELEQIIQNNPFAPDFVNTYFTILFAPTQHGTRLIADAYLPDRFHLTDQVVYVYCPNGGYGNTKLSNAFLEKQLKVTATTRNYATLVKLLEMGR